MTKNIPTEKDAFMYRKMMTIRRFEDKVYSLYLQGLIPGTLHQYQGQEAVAVGACAHLDDQDFITTTHRPHGYCIAKGVSLSSLMAELFAKQTGCCKGKGGSMHVGDIKVGACPAIAIVGAGIPIACGIGLAQKYKNTGKVVICFFGDGASNQGTFHEGINLASIWHLPVIFLCDNNLYAASTRISRVIPMENIADRACAYSIPGVVVDGMDILSVYKVVGKAVRRAREGKGPTLIEAKTYRYRGHSRSDPGRYRPREEIEEWERKDPITRFRGFLLKGHFTKEELEQVENEVEDEIQQAIEFAQNSPFPAPEQAFENVFEEGEAG